MDGLQWELVLLLSTLPDCASCCILGVQQGEEHDASSVVSEAILETLDGHDVIGDILKLLTLPVLLRLCIYHIKQVLQLIAFRPRVQQEILVAQGVAVNLRFVVRHIKLHRLDLLPVYLFGHSELAESLFIVGDQADPDAGLELMAEEDTLETLDNSYEHSSFDDGHADLYGDDELDDFGLLLEVKWLLHPIIQHRLGGDL